MWEGVSLTLQRQEIETATARLLLHFALVTTVREG